MLFIKSHDKINVIKVTVYKAVYTLWVVFFFCPRINRQGMSESVPAATTQIPKVGNLIKRRGSFGSKGSRAWHLLDSGWKSQGKWLCYTNGSFKSWSSVCVKGEAGLQLITVSRMWTTLISSKNEVGPHDVLSSTRPRPLRSFPTSTLPPRGHTSHIL